MELTPSLREQLLTFQRLEITEHYIYKQLANIVHPEGKQQNSRKNRSG